MIMASNNISSAAGGGGAASSQLGGGVGVPLPPHESATQIVQNQQLYEQNTASNNISFGVTRQSSSSSPFPPSNLIRSKDSGTGSGTGTGTGCGIGGNYDLGELDQAFFLYLDHHEGQGQGPSPIQEQKQNNSVLRPATLNIFPSQPMYVEPSPPKGSGNLRIVSTSNVVGSMKRSSSSSPAAPPKAVKCEGSHDKAPASTNNEQQGPPPKDAKTLRRLAQNREAARKSRLRKKAYVQQLESSRLKLTQLEQQIHKSSSSSSAAISSQQGQGQGLYIGDHAINPIPMAPINSNAGAFDIEYKRWIKENHQLMCELRNAVMQGTHLQDHDLQLYVNNCIAHLDELMSLKSMIAKSDVFHLLSGTWKTPAERCFMWFGGFRPSHLIKIITTQLIQVEALSEEQIIGICELQQSTHDAEERLCQFLQNHNHSLSDIIVSDALGYPSDMPIYINQMNLAIRKLSNVECLVRQADCLRQQAVHRMLPLLTTRQAARCCLGMAEYFHRLRALSSLWLGRPPIQPGMDE